MLKQIIKEEEGREDHSFFRVIGIDHIPELQKLAEENIKKVNKKAKTKSNFVENVEFVVGEGTEGVKLEGGEKYDVIYVGVAAPGVPLSLLQQLEIEGGRMILPVGPPDGMHKLVMVDKKRKKKKKDKEGNVEESGAITDVEREIEKEIEEGERKERGGEEKGESEWDVKVTNLVNCHFVPMVSKKEQLEGEYANKTRVVDGHLALVKLHAAPDTDNDATQEFQKRVEEYHRMKRKKERGKTKETERDTKKEEEEEAKK